MKFQRINQTGSVIPIPETYRDAIELLRSDYYRCYGRRLSFWRMYLLTFVEPTFKFLFWHRLSQVNGGASFVLLPNGVIGIICLSMD